MKRAVVFLVTMGMAVLAAIPAAATPPETEVSVFEEELEFETDPCTGSGPFVLEATFTVLDLLFEEGEGGKVISSQSIEITGPDSWSGQGTQTRLHHNGVRTLSCGWTRPRRTCTG